MSGAGVTHPAARHEGETHGRISDDTCSGHRKGIPCGGERITEVVTNSDGRTDGPILPEEGFATGTYELLFHAGDYLRASGQAGAEPLFLDVIPIRFGMSEEDHYHVPLLLSPFSFSTYRGS